MNQTKIHKWIKISEAPTQEPVLFRSTKWRGLAAVGILNALREVYTLDGRPGVGFIPTHCLPLSDFGIPNEPD